MAKPCKAYLIDPEKKTVVQVEWNGDYRQIYEHTGCDTFDVARFNQDGDVVYIDDEGLLKAPREFFTIAGYPGALAGKGLVLGTDAEGESIAPHVSLDWLRDNVGFIIAERAGPFLMVESHPPRADSALADYRQALAAF